MIREQCSKTQPMIVRLQTLGHMYTNVCVYTQSIFMHVQIIYAYIVYYASLPLISIIFIIFRRRPWPRAWNFRNSTASGTQWEGGAMRGATGAGIVKEIRGNVWTYSGIPVCTHTHIYMMNRQRFALCSAQSIFLPPANVRQVRIAPGPRALWSTQRRPRTCS